MQARISATIGQDMQQFLVQFAAQMNIAQSRVLEQGLQLLQKQWLQQQMKAGYLDGQVEGLEFAHGAEKITTFHDENL
jgi:hypothetical protein